MKYLGVVILALFPGSALAYSPGTLSLERSVRLIYEVRRTTGEIPRELDPRGEWSKISTWIQLTGGVTSRDPDTDVGSNFGVEWSLKVGVTPGQAPKYRNVAPLAFDGSVALAFRTYSWRKPFYGAIVVLGGGELGAGGGHWWSDTARATVFTGARFLAQERDGEAAMELTYILAPFVFSGNPQEISNSRRVEHRVGLTFGNGLMGVGGWVHGVRQTVRLDGVDGRREADSFALGATVEMRFD